MMYKAAEDTRDSDLPPISFLIRSAQGRAIQATDTDELIRTLPTLGSGCKDRRNTDKVTSP
jgi:hypothetical protein